MFSCTMLLSALALTLLAVTVDATTGDGDTADRNYDRTASDLRKLYNSPVYKAEKMKRASGGADSRAGAIDYPGVRVTLANGTQWLIHKGDSYDTYSDPMVTAARRMSRDWKVVRDGNFLGRKTVADFVETADTNYDSLFDNNRWADIRMTNQ